MSDGNDWITAFCGVGAMTDAPLCPQARLHRQSHSACCVQRETGAAPLNVLHAPDQIGGLPVSERNGDVDRCQLFWCDQTKVAAELRVQSLGSHLKIRENH
jgi:hypothetical protein